MTRGTALFAVLVGSLGLLGRPALAQTDEPAILQVTIPRRHRYMWAHR